MTISCIIHHVCILDLCIQPNQNQQENLLTSNIHFYMEKKTGEADLKCSLLVAKLLVRSKTCYNNEEATQLCRGFGPPGVWRAETRKLISSSGVLDFLGACTDEYHENWDWNCVVGFCGVDRMAALWMLRPVEQWLMANSTTVTSRNGMDE